MPKNNHEAITAHHLSLQFDAGDGRNLDQTRQMLREEGIEPEKMDPSQLEQYLKANKVDMSGPQKRYAAVLKKAKAQQSLERAQPRITL